ncbi:MAG: hypothetical protein E6J79_05970 [Deltaproteobacteria bacterium]|nr:MAG: hypothetical protein E6J79_05970 [Deltaproteobacteria bacterium]
MAYEIRAMSFAEILDTGFRLLRDHFALLVGLSALVNVPVALANFGIQQGVLTHGRGVALVGLLLYSLVAGPIVGTAVTFAVGELYVGHPITAGHALRHILRLVGPLAVTGLLSGLAICAGFLLLVVPGIYAMLAFMLLWQVVVLEGISGRAAMRRSRTLMRGNMRRGFGITVLGVLIGGLVGGVLGVALKFLGPMIAELGGALAQAMNNAFVAAVEVVLYFDIRCRKEAFDLEHLARVVASAPQMEPQPA